MNELLQHGTWPARSVRIVGAAGLALALGACDQSGLDDVKPTATTAYHSAAPAAQQPPPATSTAPARE